MSVLNDKSLPDHMEVVAHFFHDQWREYAQKHPDVPVELWLAALAYLQATLIVGTSKSADEVMGRVEAESKRLRFTLEMMLGPDENTTIQ